MMDVMDVLNADKYFIISRKKEKRKKKSIKSRDRATHTHTYTHTKLVPRTSLKKTSTNASQHSLASPRIPKQSKA